MSSRRIVSRRLVSSKCCSQVSRRCVSDSIIMDVDVSNCFKKMFSEVE